MSVLRTIEQKIEGLFEGVFGRAFRTHVQPVELARKLTKEMDDHRMASVSRTYAPNEFTVFLSPADRLQFADYEPSLVLELQDFLAEHARREGYVLLSPPTVTIDTDQDLPLGHFGIATRMVQTSRVERPRRGVEPVLPPPVPELEVPDLPPLDLAAEINVIPEPPPAAEADPVEMAPPAPEPAVEPAPEPVSAPEADPTPASAAAPTVVVPAASAAAEAALVGASGRHRLAKPVCVLGRSRECDVVIPDLNVSRQHLEIRLEDGLHWLVDLGSTNGTLVNGKQVKRAKLASGDRIEIGSTELLFERTER
jgi:hypothetical protein